MPTNGLYSTEFHFPGQTNIYHGKVRDVYTIANKLLVMVASDRISAFDVILPRPIPHKGQVLNQISSLFLELTRELVPNWVLSVPDPNVTIGKNCKPLKVEMVIRGYLSGHAWREYRSGKRMLCGVAMPEGMRENDKFPEPIITPSTKADIGHDVDIPREEIMTLGIVPQKQYEKMEEYTRKLFSFGSNYANERGLILVDTKYEFGEINGNFSSSSEEIVLIDEIHTPDSSRYFYLDGYKERQQKGEPQKQLSKEFVREWLIANNFMGKEGQTIPEMNDDWLEVISARYVELYEKVTGKKFEQAADENILARIEGNVLTALKTLHVTS